MFCVLCIVKSVDENNYSLVSCSISILHGNNAELLSGIQANKNNNSYFTKLYMGRFSENNDGYLLTQFVEDTEKL